MKNLKKILYLLTPLEKKKAILLTIMVIIMALTNMIGVASILPFISVVTNPSLIETNFYLKNLFEASSLIGVENIQEFIFFLGISVFILFIFSISFKAFTNYLQVVFTQRCGQSISIRLLNTYIHQTYSWFLNRNSADLSKTILSEVGLLTTQGIQPIFNLITNIITVTFLIILLIIVDINLTLILAFIIGGGYFLIFIFFQKYIKRIGNERLKANQLRFKIINETFGASKEIKLNSFEEIFVNRFSKPSEEFFKYQTNSQILGILPRYFIEAFLFGGLIVAILFITTSETGNFADSIPVIAVYAFAGYRLMPSIQSIYQANTSLKFSNATIDKIYDDLKSLELKLEVKNEYNNKNDLCFNKAISLSQVKYDYPNSARAALKDINLIIPAKKTIGLIGPTGCGKTTTADIILGLLKPQKGNLKIDDEIITKKNLSSWQNLIGYVPQHIYLFDDTISANIAFGKESKNINHDMVEKVSKIANLHKFVYEELPDKYQTIVGERGIRLSGGQRQRIGIARALYHNPKVLVLDEATSALDNQTEEAIMDALNNLSKSITIILIAHRLNTLKDCDIIFKLDKGKVVNSGSYSKVINSLK